MILQTWYILYYYTTYDSRRCYLWLNNVKTIFISDLFLGDVTRTNVAGVHQYGVLSVYACLVLGFGLCGRMVRDCEKTRWMGPSRYSGKNKKFNVMWRKNIWCISDRYFQHFFRYQLEWPLFFFSGNMQYIFSHLK